MNSTYGDIEEGTNQGSEKELGESRQILEATEAAMEEGEEHTSFVLLVNKSISRIISPQALPTENGEEKCSEMDLQNPSAMNVATLPTSESKDDMEDCDASSASCIQITDNNDQPHLPVHMQQQYVSDCCAICLDPYQVGDMIVWSSTATCPHVFHKHCFVDYLLSYRGKGAPCPSCRQSYVDECIFSISCKEQQKRNSEASSLTSTVDEEAPVVDLSAPGSSVQPIIAVEAT